ncbi:MAG: CNNM domain-containing protein, partial [Candidatus Methylomirabilis sp.]|nr:CNNM domain-containing protein [Deltaproteobacteria bacterium]
MDSVAVEVLLLAVCAALSAFFSGSETALTRLRPSAAKEMARRGGLVGAAVWRLAESPTRVISTILVGNNIVNTAMSALATVILVRELGEERGVLAAT